MTRTIQHLTRRTVLSGLAGSVTAAVLAACGGETATVAPTTAATAAPPVGNTPVGVGATRAPTAMVGMTTPATAAAPAASVAATVAAPSAMSVATAAPAAATTGSAATTAPVAPTVATGANAVDITTVSFYAGDTHPYNVLVKQYNDRQKAVRVTHQVEADYPTVVMKLQASLAAGKPLSTVTIPWNYRSYAASALSLVPIDDLGVDGTKDIFARYNPGVLLSAQSGGKTLGLPFATSLPVAYWNNDIVAAAGLDITKTPKTWDDMLVWMRAMKDKAGKNAYAGYANSWIAQAFIESAGGRILDDKLKPVMDTPESVAGITTWRSMIAGLSQWATQAEATAAFTAGNTGVMVESVFNLGNYRKGAKFPFTVTGYPTFGDKTPRLPTGGNFLAIFAKDKDQRKAAWDFITYMTSEDAMKLWVTTGYLSPTNAKVDVVPGQEAAYAEIGRAIPWQEWPGNRGLEAEKAFTDAVSMAVSGAADPQATMAKAKGDIAALLG